MQVRVKKIFCGILISLIVLEICVFSISKIYKEKIYQSKLNNDGRMFALMVEQTEGAQDYVESEDDTWPSEGYQFNKDKSYCSYTDSSEDEKIKGLIDFQDGKAIVKTTKTTFCYLYFDIQNDINFTFYLGGETNPKYTNTQNIQIYLNIDSTNVNEYCINNLPDSTGCTWKNISNLNYTLDSNNGSQTRYLFLKTKDGKILENYQSDEIILDDIPPTCSSAYIDMYNRVVFEYSDNLGLSDGHTYEIDIKDEVAAKTYYASTSDMAGNTCNYSKTIYSNNPGTTTYDGYIKSCHDSGVGWRITYQLAIGGKNVPVESCNGRIEYFKEEGYCNPNSSCVGYAGNYENPDLCKVCIANTTPASCPAGTSQIPGTNYCW